MASPNPDYMRKVMFQGQGNPLYDLVAGDGSSSAPAPPSPNLSPTPAPASPPPIQPGAIASSFNPPLSKQDYLAQNPVALPGRPTGDFDTGAHPKLRSALADLFAGMAEFGRPGSGMALANRWNDQEAAKRNYDQNLPVMRQNAENQQYETYLKGAEQGANIGKAGAETGLIGAQTQNLSLNPPGKSEFLKELQDRRRTGADDPQSLFNEYASRAPYSHATRQEVLDIINSTPENAPSFKIGPQGIREPIAWHGKQWTGDEPDAPQAIKDAAKAAGTVENKVHANKLQEQGAAASRVVMQNELATKTHNLETGQKEAGEAVNTLKDAQSQRQLMNDLLSGRVDPAGQTAAMWKMIGLEQPEGTHRISPQEVTGLEQLGGVSDRLKQKLLNWKQGDVFSKDLLPDIKQTADRLLRAKEQSANDKLQTTFETYGYKHPGSGPNGRFDNAAPAGGGTSSGVQVGQTVKIKGQDMKVTAVHPDGSFDADPVK